MIHLRRFQDQVLGGQVIPHDQQVSRRIVITGKAYIFVW
jgi:hypothetical protein